VFRVLQVIVDLPDTLGVPIGRGIDRYIKAIKLGQYVGNLDYETPYGWWKKNYKTR